MDKINWKKVIGWGIMAAIIGCLIYFNKPQEKKEKDFIERYTKTYGLEPIYTSAYGYDTGRLIVKAWVKSGKVTPETLIAQTPYDGVTGHFIMDSKIRDLISTQTLGILGKDGTVIEWK